MALSQWIGLLCVAAFVAHAQAARNCSWVPKCSSGEDHKFAIPCEDNCNNYFQCSDGKLTEKSCGKDNFDPEKLECSNNVDCNWYLQDDHMCGFNPDKECPTNTKVKIPIPCDGYCGKYIQCRKCGWTLESCSAKKSFHPTKKKCTGRTKVDCDWWKYATTIDNKPTSTERTSTLFPASPLVPSTSHATSPPSSSEPASVDPSPTVAPSSSPVPSTSRATSPPPSSVPTSSLPPSTVSPSSSPKPPPSSESTPAPATSTRPTTPLPELPTCAPPTCPDGGVIHIRDNCNCGRFYVCNQGQLETKQCRFWQKYDAERGRCRWWFQVRCGDTGCAWEPQCPTRGSSRLGIPCAGSCSKFVQCQEGVASIKSCPWFKHFNVDTLECAWWSYSCAKPSL